jgi:hypothetical protein
VAERVDAFAAGVGVLVALVLFLLHFQHERRRLGELFSGTPGPGR